MNWDHVRDLVSAGMDIGSHTHHHELLARQSREAQMHELVLSKGILRKELGVDACALSYPVGHAGTFNEVTQECLRASGYRVGFSYGGGVNTPSAWDSFNIARMSIGPCTLERYRTRLGLAAFAHRDLARRVHDPLAPIRPRTAPPPTAES
jgi:peptidoglycan/xylan/chitin deacetylase (PgdA/CDA1 family)